MLENKNVMTVLQKAGRKFRDVIESLKISTFEEFVNMCENEKARIL